MNNVSNGLVHWLKEYLAKVKKLTKDKESVSDILITKILLGTLACVPAYDRFFKNTLKELSIKQNFNIKTARSFCGANGTKCHRKALLHENREGTQ